VLQDAFDAVERGELLALARLADDEEAAGELVEVEGVEWVARAQRT
jgi:hypothetical protein